MIKLQVANHFLPRDNHMYPDQLGVGDKGSNIEFAVELLKVVFVPKVT